MKQIFLLGEAPGRNEAQIGQSFVGASGVELLRMLDAARIIHLTPFDRDYINRYYTLQDPNLLAAVWDLHPELYRTNVFSQHPPGNELEFFCGPKSSALPGFPALLKSQYVREEFEYELDRLAKEIISHDPNLIICLGNCAMWVLSGMVGITKYRGTTMLSTKTAVDFKLLPTYHPAAVLRQWELRPTAIADLMKAARESTFPELRRPKREIWIEPSLEDIRQYIDSRIRGCRLLSVDIETTGQRITCIGFAPSPSTAIVIPFDDERSTSGSYWPTRADERQAWDLVRSVLGDRSIPKLFHNGLYDVGFLLKAYNIQTLGCAEDTMLLHHALQPESLKSLGYLGSIYCDELAWKHMRKKDETNKREN